MTRENLIQAIYDNQDDWSCSYPCPHTMEEDNPKDVCMECVERQLAEYERSIIEKVFDRLCNYCPYMQHTKCTKEDNDCSNQIFIEQYHMLWDKE